MKISTAFKMKSSSLLIIIAFIFNYNAQAQLTGTVNVGPGYTYTTLKAAIDALNTNGVGSGGVTINLTVDETAPLAGASGSYSGAVGNGYVIRIATNAPTASNPLVIRGNNHLLTAAAITTPVTNYNDAVITIAGTSYVTISGLRIIENGANTTIAATNNMTEFGVAIVGATIAATHVGSQNCTISNCKIQLSNTYTCNIGIYSNSSNVFTTAYTTADNPASATGANSGNKYYQDTVYGTTSGIVLLGNATYNELNTVVGASGNGDTISLGNRTANMVMATAYVNYVKTEQDGIYAVNNNGLNVNYNKIFLATGSTTNTVNGIFVGACASSSTFTTQVTRNQVQLVTAATSVYAGIQNASGSATYATLKFNNNTLYLNATSGTLYGIYNTAAALVANFNSNNINDTNTTGLTCYNVYNTGALSTATFTNNICFNRTATGAIIGIATATGAISTCNYDNNTVNTLVTGNPTGGSYGIYNNAVAIPAPSMSNNKITITATSNTSFNMFGIYNTGNASTGATFSYDTVSIAGPGYGILNTGTLGTGTFDNNILAISPGIYTTYGVYNSGAITTADVSNNIISTPLGTTGIFNGIYLVTGTVTTGTINGNSIDINVGGSSYGIYAPTAGTTRTISNNNIKIKQTGAAQIIGIYSSPATAIANSFFNNNTIDISTTTATTSVTAFLYSAASAGNSSGVKTTINNNVFKSTSGLSNTTGGIYLIYDSYENPTDSICGNVISGRMIKTGSGGNLYGIFNVGNGSIFNTTTIANNNMSNVTVAGSSNYYGIISASASSQARVITNDTVQHISAGTGNVTGISIDYNAYFNMVTSNNYIDSILCGGNIYGIAYSTYNSPGTASVNCGGGTLSGNRIDSLYCSGTSGSVFGFNLSGTTTSVFNVYNNIMSNFVATGTTAPSLYGIYLANGTSPNIYSNQIYSFNTTAGGTANAVLYGIYATGAVATTCNIYKNNIYSLSAGTSAGATTQVNGLYLPSATASYVYNVYNNFLSAFTAPSASAPNAIVGINMTATSPTWNVYFNTIYFPALSGGANFGVTGVLFPSGSSLLTLKNNIINIATSSTLSGTGIAACVRRNVSGTGGTAPTTSNYDGNYNVYYVNSGTQNYFYAEQTGGGAVTNGYNLTNDASFNLCGSQYKLYMGSGRESQTNTENNLSAGSSAGMYIPTSSTYAYRSGLQISSPSITTDYSVVTRNNPPCRGALELIGSYPTNGAPVITYSALNSISYCIAAPPTLSTIITSGTGINSTPGTKPRLYYRGSADANIYATTNNSSVDGWKYVEASNSSSPYTFTPDYTLLNHTAAAGTTIYYFVIAQDNNSTPLVSSKTVGYASGYCPSSVALTSGAFPTVATPTINSYVITSVPSFTATVAPTIMCGTSSTAILTLSPDPADLVLQWQQDYGSGYSNISGATSNNYSATPPSIAGTSSSINYKSGAYCNGSLVATSSVATGTEYSPSVTTTTPGSRCGTGSVSLAATGPASTTLEWFSASTGGTPLGVGTTFNTPSISSTTIYYVADSFGNYGNPQSVGQSAISGATLFNLTGGTGPGTGINFTVNTTSTIQSVKIYPYYSGATAAYAFTISVYSGSTAVASYSGFVAGAAGGGTAQTVPVNFYLPPGNYQMAFSSAGANAVYQYGSSTNAFPYTTNFNSITLNSSTYDPYYFFFYDWKVVAGCLSARTPVTATVNALPTAGTISAAPNPVCSGSVITLSETGTPSGLGTMASYSWSGPNSYTSSASASSVSPVSFSPTTTAASGYYSLTVTYPGTGCTSSPVVSAYVTVNANTTPVISGTLSSCVGGTSNLSATVASGTWTSTNTAIATVDATLGIVYAVSAGSATISYTTPCGAVGTASFTVNTTPSAISGSSTMCNSSVITLTDGVGSGSWTSTNTSVASINSSTGVVTSGASTGATTISYTIGSCGVAFALTVSNTSPSSITGTTSVCVGQSVTLGNVTAGGTWSSSNTAIASVNASTGAVTGVSNGSAIISYSTGCGTAATQSETINGSSITISNNGPVCSGNTVSLTTGVGGATYSWSGPNSFTSASQNPTISSVTTAASGTYTLSATVGGCTSSATTYLVVGITPTVTVTANDATICVGGSSSLTDIVSSPTSFVTNAIPYSLATLTSPTTLTSASSWTGGNDDGYINVAMPFTFTLYGVNYSSVNISANGYINFATGFSSGAYSPVTLPSSSGSVPKSMIALFWHDMIVSSGSITYGTMGSAPNRSFIINYNAIPDASGSTTNTGQIVLHETTNNVELMVANTSSSTKTCGIQNSTGTSAVVATGENNATYAITSAAPQGWRFSTPSYNYAWSPSTALSSIAVYNPVSSGLSATQVYTVVTNDLYSACSGKTSNVSVTVNAVPSIASVTPSTTTLCTGGAVTLSAGTLSGGSGSFVSYVWTGSDGYSNTVSSVGTTTVSVSPTVAATYSVIANYSGSGCTSSVPAVSATVTPYAQPSISSITPSTSSLCLGGTITLSAATAGGVGGATYTWSGADISTVTSATSTSPVITPTLTSTHSYSLSLHYSGVGCNNASSSTAVTVNTVPSIALGATPSVCQPTTSSSISYGSVTGSPTTYNINWDATAETVGGFVDVTGGTLTGGTIPLVIPSAGTPGLYSGAVTVSNGLCGSSSYGIQAHVYAAPTATVTSVAAPCVGYAGNINFSGTDSTVVDYTIDNGLVNSFTFYGTTHALSTGIISAPHTYIITDAHNPACTNVLNDTVTVSPVPMQWVGGSLGHETEWNYTTNWSCGFAPTNSDNVTISSAAYAPVISASDSGFAKNITLNAGSSLIINSGASLKVKGVFTNNTNISGAGKVVLNNNIAQMIRGRGTVNNLELKNASGATIDTGAYVTIGSTLYITSGTLTTNDSLELSSGGSFSSARIAELPASGAAISGKLKADQFIEGGYRRFRFISHPFNADISLSQLQQYIDITGTNGAANGFTTTASNAPSAFWYNPLLSNDLLSYDTGWVKFTQINGGASGNNLFHKYEGIRLFFRGQKQQGLDYWYSYTPFDTTIKMSGNVNQGPQTITLQQGADTAHQSLNMVGNPYPSPVDIGTILYNAKVAGQIKGAAFYVWNPRTTGGGTYIAVPIGTSSATPYYLAAYGAFQVRADHNGATLSFAESNKGASYDQYLFKTTQEYTTLNIYDAAYNQWDMLRFRFTDEATDKEDKNQDAVKLLSTDFKFYSIADDGRKLAIDARPYRSDKVIPLGVGSAYNQELIIKADNIAIPEGGSLYLHDKLLNKFVALNNGAEYRFTITNNAATQGDDRFEISLKAIQKNVPVSGFAVTMTPNPATDEVKISFVSSSKDDVNLRITDMSGVSVYNEHVGVLQSGVVNVPLATLASGIYMVELTQGDQKVVHRLVKE